MNGERKKNSFATRQHVLLPVFVYTYYVLPAHSWAWVGVGVGVVVGVEAGDLKKKES